VGRPFFSPPKQTSQAELICQGELILSAEMVSPIAPACLRMVWKMVFGSADAVA
jgi:hypothetical protein